MTRGSTESLRGKRAVRVPTQQEQINHFVEIARRQVGVPIRASFVQQGRGISTVPGPLASLVFARDERALDLYLLLLLVTGRPPFDSTRDARLWARALGIAGPRSTGTASVSKAWSRLERRNLVKRSRSGRLAKIELRSENGRDEQYVPPGQVVEAYFRLPVEYWSDGWYRRLKLPGKAALLIALSLQDGFTLPSSRAKAWYGISADTLERGFKELQRAGILAISKRGRTAPEAPEGYVVENVYRLKPPFKRERRKTSR